jgi:hypothetical protein
MIMFLVPLQSSNTPLVNKVDFQVLLIEDMSK